MVAANHYRSARHVRHGGVCAAVAAGNLRSIANHLLRIMTTRRCRWDAPTQLNFPVFRALLPIFFFFAVVFATGQTSSPPAAKTVEPTRAPAATNPSSEDSKYVGAETCKTCHEEIYNSWEKTPHWKTTLNIKGGPSKQGCEGCHGPGADHVAGGGDKTKIFLFEKASAKEVDARCLTCHAGAHPNFERSAHGQAKVSCIDCHS